MNGREKEEKTISKIIGIQFSLLSPHEILKGSVAEIINRDTYINNKPVLGGLFDPRMGVLDQDLFVQQMVWTIYKVRLFWTYSISKTSILYSIFNNNYENITLYMYKV